MKITGQALDLLSLLLERPGETISREEIQRRLWPDRNVEFDHHLDVLINRLRSALGDAATNSRFIHTVPKKGYKFVEAARGRYRLRRFTKYAAVAAFAAILAILFARTRYQKFVPSPSGTVSRTAPR